MINLQPGLANEQIGLYPLKVCDFGDLYAVAADPGATWRCFSYRGRNHWVNHLTNPPADPYPVPLFPGVQQLDWHPSGQKLRDLRRAVAAGTVWF